MSGAGQRENKGKLQGKREEGERKFTLLWRSDGGEENVQGRRNEGERKVEKEGERWSRGRMESKKNLIEEEKKGGAAICVGTYVHHA